jgi:ankyrin repeat protein
VADDADLFAAIDGGDADRLGVLVGQDRARAGARDEIGRSAVLRAQYVQRADLVGLLLACEPELDAFDAAAVGDTPRLAGLVDADGSLVHARNGDGFTPLHYAAYFGHLDAARLLLEHGSDAATFAEGPIRVMPLHSAASGGHTAIAELLLEHGAPVDAAQPGGYTPLHAAAHNGDVDTAEVLLRHGADVTLKTDAGDRPADTARAAGHDALARRLEPGAG